MKKFLSIVNCIASLMVLVAFAAPCRSAFAQAPRPAASGTQKIILDTDIGDDIDDAFALALALASPRLQLLGVTTAWGDTDLRARLAARFLTQTGHSEVPVASGPKTAASSIFTQARWARHSRSLRKPGPMQLISFSMPSAATQARSRLSRLPRSAT